MKSSQTRSSSIKKRLPLLQIVLGVAVLVLISSALVAGKYLSQGDTDARSQAAGGQQFTVCPSGSPGTNGCDFVGLVGLQQGVDQAQSGSTFLMKSGVYRITHTVKYVMGSQAVFDTGLLFNREKVISIIGEADVVIDGKEYAEKPDSAILVANGTVAIEGVTVTNVPHYGIIATNNSNLTVKNSVIKNCNSHGIISNSTGALKVERSMIKDVQGGGIVVMAGTAIIDRNSVSAVKHDKSLQAAGINCALNSRCEVRNNTAYNNAGVGIIGAQASNFVVLSNNYSYGNQAGNYNDWPNWPPAGNYSTPPTTGGGTPQASPTTGGGTPTTLPTSNTWGSRTIVGQIKCTNVAGMTAPLNQPYAIPNIPIRTFWGGSAVPTSVLASATTNAQGIYSMKLLSESLKFTVRVSNNNQDHDYAFYRKRPSSLAGVTCYDNNAFELCDYLNIAAGTTKAGFDFETNVRAENLRGYQSGTNYVFEFKQAKDYVQTPIKKYVVRLDNKADGWYSASSDYYLTVPRTDAGGTGTCSGGICKITSAELNAIKAFKFGTYGMGVNPISNAQAAGQSPVLELCRNDATIQAQVSQTGTPPLPVCGSGLTCSMSVTSGATACTGGSNTRVYCCPRNNYILNGRCTAPPAP